VSSKLQYQRGFIKTTVQIQARSLFSWGKGTSVTDAGFANPAHTLISNFLVAIRITPCLLSWPIAHFTSINNTISAAGYRDCTRIEHALASGNHEQAT